MGKHSRKRQKLAQEEPNPLLDDSSKDEEERRLENLLFGTKLQTSSSSLSDEENEETGGKELQNLLDNDLFFVDDGLPQDSESGDSNDDDEDEESSGSGSGSQSETESSPRRRPKSKIKSQKAPAWVDTTDPTSVSLASKRLRKLRDAPNEESLSGREYESRLRRQFERINPEPQWAAQARKKSKQSDQNNGDDDDDDLDVNALLTSTSGILSSKSRSTRAPVIPAGTLSIERLRDANQSAQSSQCGEIKSLAFHPSERVPVLCVGSTDRRVRMYNIDGHTSPLLQTLHVPSLPITSQSSVTFHPSGTHLLLTGPRPYYFVYDLQSGTLSSGAGQKGLWGTRFEDPSYTLSLPSRKRGRRRGPTDDLGGESNVKGGGDGAAGMEVTAFSPGNGDILAVAGRGGYVHLVDWKSGAGQVLGSLKCSGTGGGIRGLWWTSPTSSSNLSALGGRRGMEADNGGSREHLAVLTGDAEVYLWDVGERRCVKRWKDDGGFRGAGRVMAGSGAGSGWLAIGSNTGLVNIYGSESFSPSPSFDEATSSFTTHPKPIKTIENLTTPISALRFNQDAQVLAMASKEKKDAMRLIHLPSLTSFSNWPTSSTPLGHVTAVDFSARSEYIAVGNTRGRVLLYHLRDYGAQS